MQGDFMSRSLHTRIRRFLSNPDNGRSTRPLVFDDDEEGVHVIPSYIDWEQRTMNEDEIELQGEGEVDVVLSDMWVPWPLLEGSFYRFKLTTYNRLFNTSGVIAKDHGSSMDLCDCALLFSIEAMKPGGSMVCKFYAGNEDRLLQKRFERVFHKVHRVKPVASRKESRECYFVALDKKEHVEKEDVFL